MGDVPERVPIPGDWFPVPIIGFVLVVRRTPGGGFVVRTPLGQLWLLARDFAVECFMRAGPYA
jgi:hypothetical protein